MKRSNTVRQTLGELRALQHLMAEALMHPLSADDTMRPRYHDGRSTATVVGGFIKPNRRLTAFERLEIYNRQYWLRLRECFQEDYPGLRALLGKRRFRDLSIAYLANHPSRSFTLRNLGQSLVDFLRRNPRWTGRRQKLAVQMARLEWAHIEAFDNAELPTVKMASLARKKPAAIFLRLQPHLTLLQLDHGLDEFLLSLHQAAGLRGEASNAMTESGDDPASRSKSRSPKRQKIWLAVHRFHNVVYYKRLTAKQYIVLKRLQNGTSLERALTSITSPAVGEWFQNWAELGWFHTGKTKPRKLN